MDKQAFGEKIMQMEPTLYGVARTFFTSPHDCADAVQEAVLRAWKARHTLQNEAYFKTWVVRILINQCKTMHRQRARVVLAEVVPEPPTPEDGMDALREAIAALALPYRLPLLLYYIEGYSTKEIAGMLRLPKGTVVSRLHRARKLLRDAQCSEEEKGGERV